MQLPRRDSKQSPTSNLTSELRLHSLQRQQPWIHKLHEAELQAVDLVTQVRQPGNSRKICYHDGIDSHLKTKGQHKGTAFLLAACELSSYRIYIGQFPTVITLQRHCPVEHSRHLMSIYIFIVEHMLAKQLTIASRCPSTPKIVGHAGYSAGSFQGVPSVTSVGHWWPKGCTRATLSTICRSIRGRTTADSCREGTGTTLLVAIMQVHKIRKQKAHRRQPYV